MTHAFIWIHAPVLVVALPLFAAFATPLLGKKPALRTAWVGGFMTLTLLAGLVLAWRVFTTGTAVYVFGAATPGQSLPEGGTFPIRILFTVDAAGALMVLIAAVVGFCATLYSLASDARHSGLEGFYALLLILVAGIMGMVCTGDLFNFFIFLEITSLSGAALAAYRIDKAVAVEAGFKYALVSTLGALMVLVATALLYAQYDALNIAELARRIQFSDLDKIALVLLVVSLALKCAAVPMHFWAPDAYTTAPSSVSALLVVSSQASLYGLIRVVFTLFHLSLDPAAIGWLLILLGVITMLVGVTMAIPQRDIKRLLAYSAVSQTGYMLLGVGVALAVLAHPAQLAAFGIKALEGGLFQIINGALYEGLLFLIAGAIFYAAGTRNLNKLGGLAHSMKFTTVFFIIGALAIIGLPPFNGFASKIMIYESVLHFNPLLTIIALVASALTLAPFVKVFHAAFMGPRLPRFEQVREAPAPMLIGMGVLATLVILLGLFPAPFIDKVIAPAAQALINQRDYIASVVGGL